MHLDVVPRSACVKLDSKAMAWPQRTAYSARFRVDMLRQQRILTDVSYMEASESWVRVCEGVCGGAWS